MKNDRTLIKTDINGDSGYLPLHITPHWQVAILKYQEGGGFFDIKRLDIHHYTDETFVITKGKAVLVAARIEGEKIDYEIIDMQPGIVYTIPVDCWHNIGQSEDAEILIVENAQTHLWDFEFQDLDDVQRRLLNEQIKNKMN